VFTEYLNAGNLDAVIDLFVWEKAREWSQSPRQFVNRAGFVLMAARAVHDRSTAVPQFLALLPLIKQGAGDERNFVKKAVSWALRQIGKRNLELHAAALGMAKQLSESKENALPMVRQERVARVSKR
jgi:3-methyladenine DNA glycosylase AlkD